MLIYILFALGFVLLITGASFLVDGASSAARLLKVPDIVVGLTIVAAGTSLPELSVNIVASMQGNTEIAIGNVLGSNIINIMLILGVSALICPLKVNKGTVWKEIPLTLFAALILGVLVNDKIIDNGKVSALTRIDGIVLLSFFAVFLNYVAGIARSDENIVHDQIVRKYGMSKSLLLIAVGFVFLTLGSGWVVKGAVNLATALGVSESLVGLTIVAAGTSLPELATSAAAAFKKNSEIAIGNIVGSNIFNIFCILGISSTIQPLHFQPQRNADIFVVILSSLMLFIFTFTGKKRLLDRWEGAVFVLLYGGYTVFLIMRG